MKNTTNVFKSILIPIVFVLLSAPSRAGAPLYISYQGKLANSNGIPVTDPNPNITFRLYTGATLLRTITPEVPPALNNGVFSVLLRVDAADFQDNDTVYLEVVYKGVPFLPKQQLVSSPYALAVAQNSVGENELKDGAVTDRKIVTVSASKLRGTIDGGSLTNLNPANFQPGNLSSNVVVSGNSIEDKTTTKDKIFPDHLKRLGTFPSGGLCVEGQIDCSFSSVLGYVFVPE